MLLRIHLDGVNSNLGEDVTKSPDVNVGAERAKLYELEFGTEGALPFQHGDSSQCYAEAIESEAEIDMNDAHAAKVAAELKLRTHQVQATDQLLADGATVPFIARYRKEVTGGLDETTVIAIRNRLEQLSVLDKCRESIIHSIEEQGKLTDVLRTQIMAVEFLAELEDLYLPYRPKRRTRATVAKEKGLEPFAKILFDQQDIDPAVEARRFVNPDKDVNHIEDALEGARDIIAEWVNEDADARTHLRRLFARKATIRARVAKGKQQEGIKYRDYYDWEEPAAKSPSHRVLAILRGANEGMLTVHILPSEDEAISLLGRQFLKTRSPSTGQIELALRDAYKRLLAPSLENEMRHELKQHADEAAIQVFAENLGELLLTPPLGQKSVLAVDPGYRTGCKVVCLDAQGQLQHTETVFPLQPHHQTETSAAVLKALVEQYTVEAIAVGNGTGGREALQFCKNINVGSSVHIVMVSESGASVYSASEVARQEFPDEDVTVRGAVSIGRRLMDPLAELVKIDPKSIGVGQYQHDIDQKALKQSLDDVVVNCVNSVGVEVNTASKQILSYVSGLSERLAENLIIYRKEHGPLRSRQQLLEVSGMGPKTFEQAAGFLRIHGAENPLDASAVHPESYGVVAQMAHDLNCTVADLMRDAETQERLRLENYVTDSIGMPTLQDIIQELAKPGRDPREPFELFTFAEGISDISHLKVGMRLPGIVTNVTAFGAFVDIGVHQDGLVHISQLADRFVRNPHDVVKVNQQVSVKVIGVDLERNRIALSLRQEELEPRG